MQCVIIVKRNTKHVLSQLIIMATSTEQQDKYTRLTSSLSPNIDWSDILTDCTEEFDKAAAIAKVETARLIEVKDKLGVVNKELEKVTANLDTVKENVKTLTSERDDLQTQLQTAKGELTSSEDKVRALDIKQAVASKAAVFRFHFTAILSAINNSSEAILSTEIDERMLDLYNSEYPIDNWDARGQITEKLMRLNNHLKAQNNW